MAKKERAAFTVEPGRVILKNGEPHLLIAVPSAFFKDAPSATQEEADKLTQRIAELLTEHGE
ncbi:hypothetical protein GC167_05975 [bacterium]|nr:hypothetical protein [bacterium]